jgi:hypothetical protein
VLAWPLRGGAGLAAARQIRGVIFRARPGIISEC